MTTWQENDLHAAQLELEKESTSLGIARYEKIREQRQEAETGPGRKLVMESIDATAAAIMAFVAEADTGKPGKRHAALKFIRHLNPHALAYPCSIEEVKHYGTSKENRIIDVLEPVLNQHRLVVDASIIRADQKSEQKYQLFYQLTRITRDRGALRHDDRLEALAMAVKYWADQLSRDVSKEEQRYLEELLDREYASFIQSVTGRVPSPDNYLDIL